MLRFFIFSFKLFLFCLIIGLFVVIYVINHYAKDLPDYSQLKEYYPPSVTRVYSADGKLIEEYAKEHRVFVPITAIPKSLIEAFVAAEDKNFYDHYGIDPISIIRAAISNVVNIMYNKRIEGGSTITQQVVKNFLLTSERSLERKIKEAILSYRVTQLFTKDEIMELYLNQIYLGKGAYGVAAAALNYFNKSVEELNLVESAMLASLPKAPSKFNPERNYDRAFKRKNYVIARMYDDGYINENVARKAIDDQIILAKHDKVQTVDADYYAEQVRSEVINMFGREYFYTAGLTIMTCLDSKLQKEASKSLRKRIKEVDRSKGYRGAIKSIKIDDWQQKLSETRPLLGLREYMLAVVLDVEDARAKIGLKDGSISHIALSEMKWARNKLKSAKLILNIGDVVIVEKLKKDYALRQIPKVNGAIMVMEPSTGRVLASEGGYDFDISKFDRTTQAKRQPGSLIKPFVFLAALENGARPNDIFEDAPIELPQGPGLPMWTPKNFEDNFLGEMTMRKGLEKSRNMITIRVGQVAGLNKIAEIVKRFGINDNPLKVHSIVLGALETTLSRMITAYAIIANEGRKVTPHYIEMIKDRKGNIIYKRDYTECPECKNYKMDDMEKALPPYISEAEGHIITDEASNYQLVSIMSGAVQRGTGRKAKQLGKVIAGKTGTSNDAKDNWFVGFTPHMIVGTYLGYDNPKSLGANASGAKIALPLFVDFMKNAYKKESLDFKIPDSIKLVSIDYETGEPSNEKGSIMEAFKANYYNPLFERQGKPSTNDPFISIDNNDPSAEVY